MSETSVWIQRTSEKYTVSTKNEKARGADSSCPRPALIFCIFLPKYYFIHGRNALNADGTAYFSRNSCAVTHV